MILIKNAVLHDGLGGVFPKHDVLVEGGKILRTGPGLEASAAKIMDAGGAHLMPGFIDPTNATGAQDITYSVRDTDEISDPLTPEADAKYAFNANEMAMEKLYTTGITAVGCCPGTANVVGGQMAVFKTWGDNSRKMLVRSRAGVKASVTAKVKDTFGSRKVCPMTHMGIFSLLERFIAGRLESEEARELASQLREKRLPLFVQAESRAEIAAVLHLAQQYGLRVVLCGAYEAHLCLDEIAAAGAAVVLGDQVYLTAALYHGTDLAALAKSLSGKGMLSFSTAAAYGPQGRVHYLWDAARFCQAGVPAEELLSMMTIVPARLLGVEARLGSIEVGKDADFTLFSQHPLERFDAQVLWTMVDGEIVYAKEGYR